MNEIKCPECNTVFKIDDAASANIIKQVVDAKFHEDLEREKLAIEKNKNQEKQIEIQNLVASHKTEIDSLRTSLEDKDEEIERVKNFRAKQSTKMLGENLEQHCEISFERMRALAFPNAKFHKDNDDSSGTKGDYIFRDYDESGIEILSIMFEMKNEDTATETKRKNESFLKKLDKDRNDKGCEFAVLVSLLELENDLYNDGIVEKSHLYPKMYVIRPQFFMPIIGILKNIAKNSLEYKRELAIVREQNLDITNFENEVEIVRSAIGRNHDLAKNKFTTAIDNIDAVIKKLNTIKDGLTSAEKQFKLANDKAQNMSIKRLTKNSPSVAAAFAELEKGHK